MWEPQGEVPWGDSTDEGLDVNTLSFWPSIACTLANNFFRVEFKNINNTFPQNWQERVSGPLQALVY